MIAFHNNLPVISLTNGRIVVFEREWLCRALGVAANRAGYPKWWLSDHVAKSVQMWLEQLGETTPAVPVALLTRAVRGALQVIGYAEVGECFEAVAPFSRISLLELAEDAGDGYELAFFNELGGRLREVLDLGGSYCELHGIEPCVKKLRRKRAWGRECAALRAEIVNFARQQTSATHRASEAGSRRELFLYVA
jgi:hypothetical protein